MLASFPRQSLHTLDKVPQLSRKPPHCQKVPWLSRNPLNCPESLQLSQSPQKHTLDKVPQLSRKPLHCQKVPWLSRNPLNCPGSPLIVQKALNCPESLQLSQSPQKLMSSPLDHKMQHYPTLHKPNNKIISEKLFNFKTPHMAHTPPIYTYLLTCVKYIISN